MPKWTKKQFKIKLFRERVILRKVVFYDGKTILLEVRSVPKAMQNQRKIDAESVLEKRMQKLVKITQK